MANNNKSNKNSTEAKSSIDKNVKIDNSTKKDKNTKTDKSVKKEDKLSAVVKNTKDKPITVTLDNTNASDNRQVKVDLIDDSEEPYVLTNDDGQKEEFLGIAVVEYEGEFYIIMKPVNNDELDEDEGVLFKLEPEDDETDSYIPVEDEELADKIFNEYLKVVDELI